jgi:D-serine deaminase-like pyridoxal phosphate-dependent protein
MSIGMSINQLKSITAYRPSQSSETKDYYNLETLPTPFALISLDKLERNTQMMASRAHRLDVKLRPHVKTHKTIEGARLQVKGHFGGITVSTLAEAEVYADYGFTDITYAVPITPSKMSRVIALTKRLEAFHVLVDHEDMVKVLTERSHQAQTCLSVLIKVDCGYGRAGVSVDDPKLLTLAQRIDAEPWLNFAGILTHGGHAYNCRNRKEIQKVAAEEYQAIIQARDLLQAQGISSDIVSLGSTPTATVFDNLKGVTEMRPGNYALFDEFQASIGSCSVSDIALSVITEVIAYYPDRQELLIDAGALALSKDEGAMHINEVLTYGRIFDLHDRQQSHLALVGLSQEHGKVKIHSSHEAQDIKIGDRLRIYPNHSCLVTALYDHIYIQRGKEVIDRWLPIKGW